jgi:hypothetical protein
MWIRRRDYYALRMRLDNANAQRDEFRETVVDLEGRNRKLRRELSIAKYGEVLAEWEQELLEAADQGEDPS